MATDICVRRLNKELKALQKDPMTAPKITVMPLETNLLEMHYVIEVGNEDDSSPYKGGIYHGKLIFPKEYPLRPPSVIMLTPSGRFQPNRRLCLSMSDFHPESWNPMWSVSTILTGLYSFMNEAAPTLGSIQTSHYKKQQLAQVSLAYNVRDKTFCQLFPEYKELHDQREQEKNASSSSSLLSSVQEPASLTADVRHHHHHQQHHHHPRLELHGLLAGAAGLFAILSIVLAYRFF